MADRFPLIANSSANQIQELAAGDNLSLTASNIVSTGIVTVSAPVDISKDIIVGAAATIAGVVDLNSTTDSTSSTTGALQIAGGVGIAKNVYIGAGLSVAGTLTYEDVTNVDSVGLITAKSGVNISGGQLQVGVAYSVGAAGVCTAAGFVGNLTGTVTGSGANLSAGTVPLTSLDLDGGTDIGANLADADLFIVDDGAGGTNRKTAASRIKTYVADLTLTTAAQTAITSVGTLTGLTVNGDTSVASGGELKVGTAVTISSTSGVGTFSKGVNVPDSQHLRLGDGEDLLIQHNGTNSFIDNNTGDLYLQTTGSGDDILIQSADDIYLQPQGGEDGIQILGNGEIKIYYDGSKKLETTNDGTVTTGISTATVSFVDAIGNVRYLPADSKSSAYVLVAGDAGKAIYISTGGVTVNQNIIPDGGMVTIINNSGSSQTITQGSSVNLYNTSDGSTGNKTLTTRGTCTLWAYDGSNIYISGNFS